MMNDTIKEYNGKNTYTNKVCHTLRLGGSWNLVTLNSRVGEGGGGWERRKTRKYCLGVALLGRYPGHPFKLQMQNLKNFHMPWWDSYSYIQSYLVILLPKYFISFSAKKSKHITSNLKYLKWQKVGRVHLIVIFRGEFPYEGNLGNVDTHLDTMNTKHQVLNREIIFFVSLKLNM